MSPLASPDPDPPVPRLRARVRAPLRPSDVDRRRAARQHVLQALLLLRHGVLPHQRQGVRTTQGNERERIRRPKRIICTRSLLAFLISPHV